MYSNQLILAYLSGLDLFGADETTEYQFLYLYGKKIGEPETFVSVQKAQDRSKK